MMAHLMVRGEPRLSGGPRTIKWAIIAAPWY